MRDLTKVLSDAETLKLRALLSNTPDIDPSDRLGQEYPKMLFHPDYIPIYRIIKNTTDHVAKKEAQVQMRRAIVIVHDIETEEDYLADHWRADPNDFITMSVEDGGLGEVDPRIPTGREGRKAEKQNKASRDAELRALQRRYAELTGTRLADASFSAPEPPLQPNEPLNASGAKAPKGLKTPPITTKREKVQAAARRASGHSSAHA